MVILTVLNKPKESVSCIVDDGKNYVTYEVPKEGKVITQSTVSKNNYRDYSHFANAFAKFEPYCWFPNKPEQLEALTFEEVEKFYMKYKTEFDMIL